ncbi:type II toxin-antitoxin system prevent-host-death family antitoxin [Streptomyces alboflavus]|uniref:type II toxin-antitoxin system prevent-host-death family antitoxin n=1 Tax=Streptomyces alboflavus TaxID=67267 RepID=UPI00099600C5|nr:type II toxin-antitoxin system prevent-host-death family antitoxin [Streptomyces alboflavus]
MRDTYTVDEAHAVLDELVHRASHPGERITITADGEPVAVLISARELAALEDALASAQYALHRFEAESHRPQVDGALHAGGALPGAPQSRPFP